MSSAQPGYTLPASERLKLRKKIETLFQKGEAFSAFPLRVVYLLQAPDTDRVAAAQVGFSIPKKRVRKATMRNRIRRLLKESWRLQKQELYPFIPPGMQLQCFLIFSGNETFSFPESLKAVNKVIDRLKKAIILPEQ